MILSSSDSFARFLSSLWFCWYSWRICSARAFFSLSASSNSFFSFLAAFKLSSVSLLLVSPLVFSPKSASFLFWSVSCKSSKLLISAFPELIALDNSNTRFLYSSASLVSFATSAESASYSPAFSARAASAALTSSSIAFLFSRTLSAFPRSLSLLSFSTSTSAASLWEILSIEDNLSRSTSPLLTTAFKSSIACNRLSLASDERASKASFLELDSLNFSSICFFSSFKLSMAYVTSIKSSFAYSFFNSRFSTFFRIILISSSLCLSRSFRYSFAFTLSSRSPSIRPSISPIISCSLSMLTVVDWSFLSASAFFVLYATTPAASSKISRLDSVLLLMMSAILP